MSTEISQILKAIGELQAASAAMKPEAWIAIYAAVVATIALFLNFRSWLEARPRLYLRLIADGTITGGDPEHDEKNLIILTVTNRGREPTMISNMVLFKMDSWWQRLQVRPSKAFIIPNPQMKGYPPNLPADLGPAQKWTGIIRERLDILPDVRNGTYYAGVHTNHRDKPFLLRIPKNKQHALTNAKHLD